MKLRSASAFLSVLTVVVAMAVWTGGSHLASRHAAERAAPAVATREDTREQVLKAYANQPVTFVENRGQLDTQVRYYDGAAGLVLDGDGGLRVQTALGVLRDAPPVAWQEIAGMCVPIDSRYALNQAGGAEMEYGWWTRATGRTMS